MGKSGGLLKIAGFLLLLSVVIFIYSKIIIPRVRTAEAERVRAEIDDNSVPKRKVAVVVDASGISKYTVLSEEIIGARIKIVDMPIKYAVKSAASDLEQLKGKLTIEDLRQGEQVSVESMTNEKKWFGEFDRLREFRVANTVAGELKTGNIIDVLVSYSNGDYDVVVPKIKVRKLLEDGQKQETGIKNEKLQNGKMVETKAGDNVLTLAIDEEQYRDLELAGRLGKLETRIYLDEGQTSSRKTFNYSSAISKLMLNISNEKSSK